MRVCSSCGRENPDDRDFCECGEYLRWDPTGVVQAVTPEVLQAAQDQAPPPAASRPPPRSSRPSPPPPSRPRRAPRSLPTRQPAPAAPQAPASPANGAGDPLAPAPPQPPAAPPPAAAQPPAPAPAAPPPATLEQPVAPPPPAPPAQPAEPDPAAISLRLPEGDQGQPGETVALGVEPGGRDARARARAQPERRSSTTTSCQCADCRTTGGRSSRTPCTSCRSAPAARTSRRWRSTSTRRARPRPRRGSGTSRSSASRRPTATQAAAAPLKLGIQPFEEFKTKLAPERASGRKKANYDVAVHNTANAPVTVALDAADQDNELKYAFSPATLEIPPGQTGKSKLQVKPPRSAGSAARRRSASRSSPRPATRPSRPRRRRTWTCRRARSRRARTARAAVTARPPARWARPRASACSSASAARSCGSARAACACRARGFTRPAVPGGRSVDLMKLRKPGSGAPMPQMPLMPNQVVFRHKAWLPWWVAVLIPLLLLLALLLFLFLPRNVVVPDVAGTKSAFEAEKKLTKAQLKLAPDHEGEGLHGGRARHRDRPDPGRRREGEEGLRRHDRDRGRQRQGAGAEHRRQDAGRSGADPREGEAHDRPGRSRSRPTRRPRSRARSPPPRRWSRRASRSTSSWPRSRTRRTATRPRRTDGGGGGGGGGGGKAAAVTLPALGGSGGRCRAGGGRRRARAGQGHRVLARRRRARSSRTEPPAGTKLKAGDKVKLVVSGGFPELDLRRRQEHPARQRRQRQALPGRRQGPDAGHRPDVLGRRHADRLRRATASVFLKDLSKKDATAVPLTAARRQVQRPRVGADASTSEPDRDAPRQEPGRQPQGPGPLPAAGHARTRRRRSACRSRTSTWTKTVSWAPDGKSIFALGVKPDASGQPTRSASSAGRRRSRSPPITNDWGKGSFMSDISNPAKGVIDWALSPDGKTRRGGRQLRQRRLPALLRQAQGLPAHRRQAAGRARLQGRVALRRPGDRRRAGGPVLRGGQRPARAHAGQEPGRPAAAGLQRRQPRLPAADAGVAVLCTSCRRQLSRGAEYCGNCGTPVAGAAEPLELVLARRDARPARRRHDDRPRAGHERRARTTRACRASTRASRPGATAAGSASRTPARAHGTLVDGVAISRATALHDGASLQLGAQTLRVERRRDTSEAGRTIVVKPGASLVVPVDRPAGRGGAGDAVRDEAAGALGLRAQAARRQRGQPSAGCSRTSTATRSCGCPTTTRTCSSCSTARTRWST